MIQLNKSKYLLISKYIFQKNFLNRNFNRKVRYREGVLIDFFIIVQGTLSISIRHTGLQFNDDEEKEDEKPNECKELTQFDVICCDNVWKYVPKYTQNTSIRYFHNSLKYGKTKAILLKVPLIKYKEIIK